MNAVPPSSASNPAASRRLSRWRMALVLMLAAVPCAVAVSQGAGASLYWAGDSAVGTVQLNDATGALVDGTRNDTSSTGCLGQYSWTANSAAVYGNSGDFICRGSLDGVSPATDASWVASGCNASGGVGAVYATEAYVYYMCMSGGKLGRVNVDGSNNIQDFGSGSAVDRSYAYRLTADANWVYASGGGQIRRYPIDGGPMDADWSVSAGDVRGLAVDSQHLYWTSYPSHVIRRANLDGTGVDENWLDVGSQFDDGVWGVTVTGSSIYWMTRAYSRPYPGTIGRANLDGTGMAEPLLDNVALASQNHQIVVLGGAAKTPLAAALANTAVPSYSGTVAVGEALTATPGTWSATPDETYYQWQVSSDSGATWTAAPGAGAQTATYTVVRADIGKTLRVKVRAGSNGGLLTTASSNATPPVAAPAAPVNTALPTATQHGLMLLAGPGTWTNAVAGDPSFAYQWQVSATGAPGTWSNAMGPGNATSAYLEQGIEAASGVYMRVRVTASNGTDAVAYSAPFVAPELTAPLGRVYLKSYSVLGDGFGVSDYTNPGGVWGFSSNGTTNVWAGWTNTYSQPAGGGSATSLFTYGFGAQSGVLVDDQYIYFAVGGHLQRMDLDGSNRNADFISGLDYATYYLARDRNYLYWRSGSTVRRAPIAGGPVDADWTAQFDADVEAVAVDGDHIYVTFSGRPGDIGRADISGSGAENAWAHTGYSGFKGLGVDRNGLYVEARSGSCVGLVYIAPDGAASACLIARDDDSYAISVVPDAADAGALPVAAASPAITGTHAVGDTVTASHGTWSNSPGSYTYRWLVSDHGANTWTVATGDSGTTANYVIPGGYAGKDLKVRVIAHNGSTWSEPAYSALITVPAPPANAGGNDLPVITGTVQVGETLTASHGQWSFAPAGDDGYAYQWQVSDDGSTGWAAAAGQGAATATYVVAAGDDAKYLRVKVTATTVDGSTDAFSSATTQVQLPEPDNSVPPVITGTAAVGQVLTASRGTWTNAAEYAFAWQVSDDGLTWNAAAGDGAGTDTYTVAAGDLGKYLRVVVTGSNRSFSVDQESAATGQVAAAVVPAPAPSPTPEPAAQPQAAPAPVVVAPGISVGETFNTANLDTSTPAAAADLLKAAKANVPASATITFVVASLPKGVRLVDGKLVADVPGTYVIRVKVTRNNGKVGTRRVKIKVG